MVSTIKGDKTCIGSRLTSLKSLPMGDDAAEVDRR